MSDTLLKCRAICTVDPKSNYAIFVWRFFDENGHVYKQALFAPRIVENEENLAEKVKRVISSFKKVANDSVKDEVYSDAHADKAYRSILKARLNRESVDFFKECISCFAEKVLFEDTTLTEAADKIIEFFEIRQLCGTADETVEAYQQLEQFAQGHNAPLNLGKR